MAQYAKANAAPGVRRWVIFDDQCAWEMQFLFQDLLHGTYGQLYDTRQEENLDYSDPDRWLELDNIGDMAGNCIVVVGSNSGHPYETIRRLLQILKPTVVFHMNDEWGDKGEWQHLARYATVLVRQHHHAHYPQYPNIIHIPLCYMSGMFESDYENVPLKSARDRAYKWSFIGTTHSGSDRQEMRDKMSALTPCFDARVPHTEVAPIYRNSVFVVHSRNQNGYFNAYRVFEAATCGAIPVLAGARSKIDKDFHMDDDPPFLVFGTWEEACAGCKELLEDEERLDVMREDVVRWRRKRVSDTRGAILEALGERRGRMWLIRDGAPWEKQFVRQDVLAKVDIKKIIEAEGDLTWDDISAWKRLDDLDSIVGNNVLSFSSNATSFANILGIVKLLRPKVIIHLSDEWGNKEEFQALHSETPLLVRQYYHSHYLHKRNIAIMPLGYMSGMMEPNYMEIALKRSSERSLKWSFVGRIKAGTGRPEMVEKMLSIRPHLVAAGGYGATGIDPTEMRDIYRNSVFVPNGRGNVKLACFRLYEASACGAIPIVVGPDDEVAELLKWEGSPPWLICGSWDEARSLCEEKLGDSVELDRLGQENAKWWKRRVGDLQVRIASSICSDKLGFTKCQP